MRPNNICCIVIGGYTGVPACSVIAYKCPEVRLTILDNDRVISELNGDIMPHFDKDMEQVMKKCRNRNLFFTTNSITAIRDADLIFLSLNDSNKAPGNDGNAINWKQLEDTIKLIVAHTESDTIIVENSRMPLQAAERITSMLPPPRQSLVRFQVISSPNFLSEGSTFADLIKPSRVLIGCQNNPISRAAAKTLSELYERWVPQKNIYILHDRSAEVCKTAGHAFLAQKISNLNSLSEICEQTGAKMSDLTKVFSKNSKLGSDFSQISENFGSFLPEITNLVSQCRALKLEESAAYWQAVLDMNEYQKVRNLKKIETILGPLIGKEIAVWGFTNDKDTSNTKNSPGMEICRWLLSEKSKIKVYDPRLPPYTILKDLGFDRETDTSQLVEICNDAYEASKNTSAIIICTNWDEFEDLDYSKILRLMATPIIIDGRKCLKEKSLKDTGINFHTVNLNYGNA